jgi:hypothetical protein
MTTGTKKVLIVSGLGVVAIGLFYYDYIKNKKQQSGGLDALLAPAPPPKELTEFLTMDIGDHTVHNIEKGIKLPPTLPGKLPTATAPAPVQASVPLPAPAPPPSSTPLPTVQTGIAASPTLQTGGIKIPTIGTLQPKVSAEQFFNK